ncbi:MAG: hypothetical protein ABSA72_03075 [Nitrososphaerales archaeon]|jgi:hypothetical protein
MKRSTTGLVIISILVLAVVAAAYLVTSDKKQGSLSAQCAKGESGLASVLGRMTMQSGTDSGNLTLTVDNSTCSPIVAVTVSASQPTIAGVVNSTFVDFYGSPVSASNRLPSGEVASGYLAVSGVTVGQQYKLTVLVSFYASSTPQTLTVILVPGA